MIWTEADWEKEGYVNGRKTKIELCSLARPHMRAFWCVHIRNPLVFAARTMPPLLSVRPECSPWQLTRARARFAPQVRCFRFLHVFLHVVRHSAPHGDAEEAPLQGPGVRHLHRMLQDFPRRTW